MRYVAALFDAPLPAQAAVAALVAAGFHPDDVATIPPLPGSAARGTFAHVAEPGADGSGGTLDPAPEPEHDRIGPPDPVRLARLLGRLGFDGADAARNAEGVRRGAILLVVRAPTLSAPVAAQIIAALAPPDPAAMAAAWEADPDLTYGWADVPAPLLLGQ